MSAVKDLRYIVTGTASGIGEATAKQLKRAGAIVASLDRRSPAVEVDQHIQTDLSDPVSIDAAAEQLDGAWDGLLNIAGVPGTAPPETVIAVNFLGLRYLTETMLNALRPGSAIVNVSSIADVMWPSRAEQVKALVQTATFADGLEWFVKNPPEGKVYNFSKEVVSVYTMSMALDLVKRGLRINGVRPGLTRTPLFGDFENSMGSERVAAVESLVGRHAQPDDIARVIVFLASPDSTWINGQLIAVDGGLSAGMTIGRVPLPGVK